MFGLFNAIATFFGLAARSVRVADNHAKRWEMSSQRLLAADEAMEAELLETVIEEQRQMLAARRAALGLPVPATTSKKK